MTARRLQHRQPGRIPGRIRPAQHDRGMCICCGICAGRLICPRPHSPSTLRDGAAITTQPVPANVEHDPRSYIGARRPALLTLCQLREPDRFTHQPPRTRLPAGEPLDLVPAVSSGLRPRRQREAAADREEGASGADTAFALNYPISVTAKHVCANVCMLGVCSHIRRGISRQHIRQR